MADTIKQFVAAEHDKDGARACSLVSAQDRIRIATYLHNEALYTDLGPHTCEGLMTPSSFGKIAAAEIEHAPKITDVRVTGSAATAHVSPAGIIGSSVHLVRQAGEWKLDIERGLIATPLEEASHDCIDAWNANGDPSAELLREAADAGNASVWAEMTNTHGGGCRLLLALPSETVAFSGDTSGDYGWTADAELSHALSATPLPHERNVQFDDPSQSATLSVVRVARGSATDVAPPVRTGPATTPAPSPPTRPTLSESDGIYYFQSPSKNINCEGHSTEIYCAIYSRSDQVTLQQDGRVTVAALHSNPSTDARVLPYGQSVAFYGFRCTSSATGMTCLRESTGHGVELSRTGAKQR